MAFSLGEYQDIFLEEADEQLQELNQNLLELEKNPDDIDIINDIFRAAHSLKSSAAFVGLNELSNLAHSMENLLQGIRDETLDVTPEIVDVIFKCFDEINDVIETIASGEEPTQDLAWLIDEIHAVGSRAKLSDNGDSAVETEAPHTQEDVVIPKTDLSNEERRKLRQALEEGKTCSEIVVFIDEMAKMKWVKAQLVLSNLSRIGSVLKTFPSSGEIIGDDNILVFKVIFCTDQVRNEIVKSCNVDLIKYFVVKDIVLTRKEDKVALTFSEEVEYGGDGQENESLQEETEMEDIADSDERAAIDERADEVEEVLDDSEEDELSLGPDDTLEDEITVDKISERVEHEKRRTTISKTVKVSIDKLDQLLNNVGELVIANSGFYKLYEQIRKEESDKAIANEFKNRMEQMSRIAKDLQTGIMMTRMVQIGQIFSRFNRLVRDLAREFDKDIELIIKGEETELDKKVIDAIGEPLLHLIRNAIDHGIEPQDDRVALGKSETAHVTLNAYQGGNQIFVEVSDDGRGLDVDHIKRKVIEKGLATPEAIANMDHTDIYNFIFAPGFSTADKVTDLSGRGVGMNVVKQIVAELNGTVAIETEKGMGTRFIMTFPLTLAIIPAIMVKVRNEMYAIPLSDVTETIKIAQGDITTIEGHEVINLRGEILSLLRLSNFIKLKTGLKKGEKIPVVVVGFGNRKIGLIVDQLEGKQEIVIKSLEQNYKTVEGLAGASILGDGSICLILDIAAMINKVISDQDKLSRTERQSFLEGVEEIDYGAAEDDSPEEDDWNDTPPSGGDTGPGEETPSGSADSSHATRERDVEEKEEAVRASESLKDQDIDGLEPVDLSSESGHFVREEPVEEKEDFIKADTADVPADSPSEDDAKDEQAFTSRDESVPGEEGDDAPESDDGGQIEKDEALEAAEAPSQEVPSDEKNESSPAVDMSTPDAGSTGDQEKTVPAAADAVSSEEGDDEVSVSHDETDDKEGRDVETTGGPDDEEVEARVHDALEQFKQELKDNVSSAVDSGDGSGQMEHVFDISRKDINEFQLIANVGATNAAESLSKILDKRIDLTIPMVQTMLTEKVPAYLGDVESIYMGVMMPFSGDVKGTVLFIFHENSGFELIDICYGGNAREKKVLDEEGESALSELTNIVGSSVINVFAEKTGMAIKPDVPIIVHDYMESIIDSILVMENMDNDYALIMDTSFYFETDELIGNLLIFPEANALKILVEKLRTNA